LGQWTQGKDRKGTGRGRKKCSRFLKGDKDPLGDEQVKKEVKKKHGMWTQNFRDKKDDLEKGKGASSEDKEGESSRNESERKIKRAGGVVISFKLNRSNTVSIKSRKGSERDRKYVCWLERGGGRKQDWGTLCWEKLTGS